MRMMSYKWSVMPGATIAMLMLVCAGAPGIKQKERDLSAITQSGETEAGNLSYGLELRIKLSQKAYQLTTPILLEARFLNTGKAPLTIVKMVDGSIEGMRYPKYTIHLVTDEGQAAPKIRYIRCGNVNPLYEGDLAQVQPRQMEDPFAPIDCYHFRAPMTLEKMYDISRPGRYRVWLEYSYAGSDHLHVEKCVYQSNIELEKDKSALERLRRLHIPAPDMPPLEVDRLKSNEVTFEIIP